MLKIFSHRVTKSINDKAVCGTPQATPGLSMSPIRSNFDLNMFLPNLTYLDEFDKQILLSIFAT